LKNSTWNPQTLCWDGGTGFDPQFVLFTIEDASPTVHSLTVQKKNGEHLLIIWDEMKTFDSETRSDLRRGVRFACVGFDALNGHDEGLLD